MQQMAIGQLYLQQKRFRHPLDSRVTGIESRSQDPTVSRNRTLIASLKPGYSHRYGASFGKKYENLNEMFIR
jgi:hypothetical protein